MTNYFGDIVTGKDGKKYKSQFEAMFSNKFLFDKGFDYEYEKYYDDGTKSKCDFYIPKWDLYIELVYNPVMQLYAWENKSYVKLNTPYEHKEFAKKHGALWDFKNKTWYCNPQITSRENMLKLHNHMDKELRHKKGKKNLNNFLDEKYEDNLEQKVNNNKDKRIVIVYHKNIKPCKSIEDIIRVRNNPLFLELYNKKELEYKVRTFDSAKLKQFKSLTGNLSLVEKKELLKFLQSSIDSVENPDLSFESYFKKKS